jgi:hypothetical protein
VARVFLRPLVPILSHLFELLLDAHVAHVVFYFVISASKRREQ